MSQFILCKGDCPNSLIDDTKIIKYPFENSRHKFFYNNICRRIWTTENMNHIWTIEMDKKEIDDLFIDAQKHTHKNISFKKTKLYQILVKLLKNNIEIVLFYSDIINDIELIHSKSDFFNKVIEGVRSEYCEVNIRYKNLSCF